MSEKNDKSDSVDKSFSDSLELFNDIFSETDNADAFKTANGQSDSPEKVLSEKALSESRPTPEDSHSILESDVKDVAVKFWKYLKQDRKETFLDADLKDVSSAVINFLGQDVAGQKIVVLEDETLRKANVVARALKRKRSIIKTDKEKSAIAHIRKIHKYLNNPFWQHSVILEKSQKYLSNNLRRVTPSLLKGLTDIVEKLQTFFNGNVFDDNIFSNDVALKQMSMNLGFKQFAVCERQKIALAKNKTGEVFCTNTGYCKVKCPFDACKAHGEEKDFLTLLCELLTKMGIIKYSEKALLN
ncbi:MAG: hypothetical protein JRC68_07930 [Deltaproteobacteria bacterium]|nr:hypothetical protein [Deltaproteobacteria bacterium]